MPMITVCPKFANINSVLFTLLTEDPGCAGNDLAEEISTMLTVSHLKERIVRYVMYVELLS